MVNRKAVATGGNLAKFEHLEVLSLSDKLLTDKGARFIKGCKRLARLDLSVTEVPAWMTPVSLWKQFQINSRVSGQTHKLAKVRRMIAKYILLALLPHTPTVAPIVYLFSTPGITKAKFGRIVPKMMKAEVDAILGCEGGQHPFCREKWFVWIDYSSKLAVFVRFNEGRVVEKRWYDECDEIWQPSKR